MGDKRFKVGPSWVLDHKISQGSFGKVYKGQHATTGKPVAVKLEPLDVRHPQLPPEAEIYMCLQDTHGVPRLYWHGHVDGRFDGIVLDLLGPDLDALYTYCGGFSLSTVILLGLQIIERVRGVHDAGFVYRDIKPQNFAIGLGETGLHTVHILDFGLAKATSVIAARGGSSGLVGTARYASISAHRGEPASFGNDLESVGYMMMYWLRGRLPWSGLKAKNSREKYEKILRKKPLEKQQRKSQKEKSKLL